MRKKPYLSFKDLRAALDRNGRVRLSSSDPRLAKAGWVLTLNRHTRDEQLLQSLLEQHLSGVSYDIEPERKEQEESYFVTPAASVGNAIVRRPTGHARGSIGPYIGSTLESKQPVFYSPVADLTTNQSSLCLISGPPGSGSIYAAQKMLRGAAQQGVAVVSLSWHDGPSHGSTLRQQLILRDLPDGYFNPFALAEGAKEGATLAFNAAELMLGGAHMLDDRQRVLLERATQTIAERSDASLDLVIELLEKDDDSAAKALAYNLSELRAQQHSRLVFKHSEHEALTLQPGITNIVPMGLRLPDPNLPDIQRSLAEQFAIGATYLIVASVKRALEQAPRQQPKLFYMDEIWTLMPQRSGFRLLHDLLQAAHSTHTGIALASQRPKDLKPLRGLQGATMVFGPRSKDLLEAASLLEVGEPTSEGERDALIEQLRTLGPGQCYMKDAHGRKAAVQWDAPDEYGAGLRANLEERIQAGRPENSDEVPW